jgi:hypothetical protein
MYCLKEKSLIMADTEDLNNKTIKLVKLSVKRFRDFLSKI